LPQQKQDGKIEIRLRGEKMPNPKISVVVPAYQVEETLSVCLDSILAQTYRDFEIIIINDGSTDKTQSIIQSYAQKHPFIRGFTQNNQGLLRTRERGLREVRGKYVLFVDSDDWIDANTLKLCFNESEKRQNDMTTFNFIRYYDAGKQELVERKELEHPSLCLRFFKASFLRKIDYSQLPSVNLGEDWMVAKWIDLLHPRTTHLNQYLYYYYFNPNSIITTMTSNYKILLDRKNCYNFVANKYREFGVFSQKRGIIDSWIKGYMQWAYWRKEDSEEVYGHVKDFFSVTQQKYPSGKKKKILFVISTLLGGGAERILVDLVKNLDKELFDVTVLNISDEGIYIEEIKKHARYKSIYCKSKSCPELSVFLNGLDDSRISQFAIDEYFDIEVAFLEDRSTQIVANSPNKKNKKIAWVHSDVINFPWTASLYESVAHQKETYQKFSQIAFVSESSKDSFVKKFGIEKNLNVINNPIDIAAIREKANEKMDVQLPKKRFTIVTIGRLQHEKGFERLILIHKKLLSLGYDYDLWIVGEGKEKGMLQKLVAKLGLRTRVKFLGFKTNPYPYLKQADLYVCSSLTEGFPTTPLEAMALGIPVLATDCGGTRQQLGDGQFGLLVGNTNIELEEGLKSLINNEKQLKYFQVAATLRINNYSQERIIPMIEKFLRE